MIKRLLVGLNYPGELKASQIWDILKHVRLEQAKKVFPGINRNQLQSLVSYARDHECVKVDGASLNQWAHGLSREQEQQMDRYL